MHRKQKDIKHGLLRIPSVFTGSWFKAGTVSLQKTPVHRDLDKIGYFLYGYDFIILNLSHMFY